eukprot:8020565-Pyramimonas_sp.AAC.1
MAAQYGPKTPSKAFQIATRSSFIRETAVGGRATRGGNPRSLHAALRKLHITFARPPEALQGGAYYDAKKTDEDGENVQGMAKMTKHIHWRKDNE